FAARPPGGDFFLLGPGEDRPPFPFRPPPRAPAAPGHRATDIEGAGAIARAAAQGEAGDTGWRIERSGPAVAYDDIVRRAGYAVGVPVGGREPVPRADVPAERRRLRGSAGDDDQRQGTDERRQCSQALRFYACRHYRA